MKIYDESLYCQECGTEISIQESLFNFNLCDDCSFSTETQDTDIPDTREVYDVRAINGTKLA